MKKAGARIKLHPMITVKVFATFRKLAEGRKEVVLDVPPLCSVRKALEMLFDSHPRLQPEILDESGAIRPHVSVFANGRDVRHRQGLDTMLHAGETLALFPPVAGG